LVSNRSEPFDEMSVSLEPPEHFEFILPAADVVWRQPDPRLLAATLRASAASRALHDPEGALQYGAERGPAGLLERLAAFLTRQTGVSTPARRLMITAGVSQTLDLICTVFTEPGDVVLVESTVPPRTSRAVVARLLGMESDLEVG
jgi:DNA-binding transcriptional MocR family regulator